MAYQFDTNKVRKIYDTLAENGYEQDWGTFQKGFYGNENTRNRQVIYDLLKANGEDVGNTYNDFMSSLAAPATTTNIGKVGQNLAAIGQSMIPKTVEAANQRAKALKPQPSDSYMSFKLRRGGKDILVSAAEAKAAGGIQAWAAQRPGTPWRVYMSGGGFDGHVPLSEAHNRWKQKGYQYTLVDTRKKPAPAKPDRPLSPVEQAHGMLEIEQQIAGGNKNLSNIREQAVERMQNVRKAVTRPLGESELVVNPQTGKRERTYYTEQGNKTNSKIAQSAENTAYNQWWENNTEEGNRSKSQRLNRELEYELSSGDSYFDDAAAAAWDAAEKRLKADRERIANDIYSSKGDAMSDAVLLGGSQSHIMNAAENNNRSMVARFTHFDLDRLMADAWYKLDTGTKNKIVNGIEKKLYPYFVGKKREDLHAEALKMAQQQSKLRVYQLAVEKNAPKDALDYLMRKIGDMNLLTSLNRGMAVMNAGGKTGDMAAYEAANEIYRQDGHKILDVTGMVAGFALDPTTWLSAGVGSAATRGAMWAGGRWLAGRGASAAVTQAATRQFATSMTGRIVGGIAGGAANFGTFEGVKEMENQFAHGGHIVGQDETGRYINEGYSAGAVAGQFGHGLMMGAAVGWLGPVSGNVSDKLVRATSSTVGKVATRAGVYTGTTLAEGTIFSVPEWIEGERDAMDVWNDNMAMMVGFKAKHILKSAGGVLGDLKASFDSPTNGQKNRLDFESRLRQRMDAPSDGGMTLTEDEKAELKRYGYDLRDLVESSERTGDPAEGSLIAQNAPEIVSRLTDMVTDPRVSEAARAKMYYYATGRRLPMSTVMRGELIEDGDGGFIVESQGANGVITSRSFKSRKAADLELERIKRQTELNSIEIGERYQQTADFENRLQEACRTVAAENGWDMVAVYRTCEEARRNHLRGGDKQFDEAQQNILRKVTEAMGEFEETGATDEIRGRINEKYGVDIDGAIRKEANRRTLQEQTAIDEYIAELIPDKVKEPNPVESAEAEDLTNQKLLTDDEPAASQGPAEGEPIDPRFDNSDPYQDYDPHQPNGDLWPKGRAVMKYQDRPVEVLRGNVVLTEDGMMVDTERSDKTIVVRDVETGKVEMVAPEAILSYEEYTQDAAKAAQPEQNGAPAEGQDLAINGTPGSGKYGEGFIRIRTKDGKELRGRLTGERDEQGRLEYYVETDRRHLYYVTEKELEDMLVEYEPAEPAEEQGGQPVSIKYEQSDSFRVPVSGREETQQAAVVGHDGERVTIWTPFPVTDRSIKIADLSGYHTDISRADLDSVVVRDEQGKPVDYVAANPEAEPEAAPAETPAGPEETVIRGGITGTADALKESFTVERERIGNEWLDTPSVQDAMRTYAEGASTVEEVIERAKADSNDERTRQRLDTLLEFDSTRQKLQALLTVPKTGETVPTSGETPHNPTENAVSPAETVPNPATPVENVQETPAPTAEPTPLQRLPRDAKGEPIFEQAENPEHGWDALVEFAEGDAATAKEIADTMAEEKRKAYEKAQKQKPKGKTPTEILASKKAISAGLAQAEQEYNIWKQMASVEQRRQDAIRVQQEIEARQRAAERVEAEKAERAAREEAERIEREALEGIPEWHLDTPENARKRGARRFSGQMFTRQEPIQGVAGKEVEVKFSQKDLPKGRVAVIEAPQLQPSHIQGQRNPMFFIEEAQPKNRAESVSRFAAMEMAEGIRPQEITDSATAYTGAPTVNTRGEVIQGNNRSDALRFLWDNHLPEQQQTYKQYLLDNAEQFGLDPEAVNAMERPVLVNMLDVDDAEAIRLGQMTAQDTESGGIERIKPKNVAHKLGEDLRTFANQLLRSGDDEATFGQLVDRNGTEVLKWMAQQGAITSTQYQSAFDSKDNLTAEAKNDLQKVLYQAIFKGGSQQLEEMFNKLPSKAQRAILATAFRDMDSPFAGKMLPEIQASIAAFNQLMSDITFATAKKMEDVLRAVEAWKQQYALDDRFEQYSPADNFSNFALHLAAMYNASDVSQTTLAGYFNQMYDLAQGKKAATLFEEADTTEYPLAEVIKQVLGIEYKPAKNGNNNVANGGADVALRNQDSQGGELRGNEPPASGEQNPTGTEPSDRGAGADGDSRRSGNDQERQDNIPQTVEVSSAERTEMATRIVDWLSDENLSTAIGKTRDEIFEEFGNELQPIAYVPSQFISLVSPNLTNPRIYCGKGYFIDHALRNHGTAGHQASVEDVDVSKYLNIQTVLDNPDSIKETQVDGKRTVVFIKKIGRFFAELTQVEEDGKIVLHKSLFNQKKEPYAKINDIRQEDTSSEGGVSSISHADESAPAISLESRGDVVSKESASANSTGIETKPKGKRNGTATPQNGLDSERKVSNSTQKKQGNSEESSVQPTENKDAQSVQQSVEAASAQVNTEPTPAQAEAGNYKKGHVTIGDFDITIENPAGSVRKGVDADGKEWSNTMANTYGYIKGTEGVDGDHIDVFLHSDMDGWNGRKVYVVDQTNTDGSFDEHKVMLGFNDKDEAMTAYLANYDKTWADTHPGLRISGTNIDDFDKWVQSSHRKTKPFAEYSTVSKVVDEIPVKAEPKQPASPTANIGEGYKIESKPYTNKRGKTLDTCLVTFDRDFSKEELSALRAKAKALKGWYDRESKGWMLRGSDDAKAFAEEITAKSEDEVADDAPLSMADMGKSAERRAESGEDIKTKGNAVKKVDVAGMIDALNTKGETKPRDHAKPVDAPKPKKRRWISDEDADEFDSLRKDLRSHFGKDGDIVQEAGAEYGKPKPKQMDAEVLRMGTRMTYLMMKGGLRSFSDYCEAMKDELPDIFDDMRPHLKSLYAAAQNMEEVIELGWDEEMDDRKTVKAFDVYNFDKPGAKDIIATAQHAVDENASQKKTEKIIGTLKERRNEKRKQANGTRPLRLLPGEDYVDLAKRVAADTEEKRQTEEVQQAKAGGESSAATMGGKDASGAQGYIGRKGTTMAGMSLFDWADKEKQPRRQTQERDDEIVAAQEADAAIDSFAEAYSHYLGKAVELEAQLKAEGTDEETRSAIREQLEAEMALVYDERARLDEALRQYYVRNNTAEDASHIALDLRSRVEAEVTIQHNGTQLLEDILFGVAEDGTRETMPSAGTTGKNESEYRDDEDSDTHGMVKTGGGYISYTAQGHLPDSAAGEFAYVERQFSRTGEFSFMGADKIRDRGDVAYLMRSLEDYSIEHVFAVFVKDGRAKVQHIGMGGPSGSFADMGAILGGYDAFGADKIYLVHNHPSGNLRASVQDSNLIKTLEKAFDGKVETEGLIIDTTSGRYSSFTGNGKTTVHERYRGEEREKKADVYSLSHADRKNMPEKPVSISTPQDVERYIEGLRFGDGTKVSYLVLSHNNQIIGNFHTDYDNMESAGLAEEIASVSTKYGGTHVVVYGHMDMAGSRFLKEEITKKSLGGVRLLDVVGELRNERTSAMDSGLLSDTSEPYGSAGVSEPVMSGRGRESFDQLRDKAVRERGIVMSGLNEATVRVVDVPRHDFTGERPISEARKWAKRNIVGEYTLTDSNGEVVSYTISARSVDKYLSSSATEKSDNLSVHLSVLKKLPVVISNSIEAEVHPDYNKGADGVRHPRNGYNSANLVHRFYGLVNIDGESYRVKTTIIESGTNDIKTKPHSFEVTKIELLSEDNSSKVEPTATGYQGRLPHGTAKLLQGVEKSYDSGKKLLDESKETGSEYGALAEGDMRFRDGNAAEELKEANRRFNAQLERCGNGTLRPEEVVEVGYPQGVMRHFMPRIPITLRQKVLSKSRKKHGLTARELCNLPEALATPIFVFKSNEATISVLTVLKSDKGENLFVAIELGKDLQLGGRSMEVNDILTIHGREMENVVLPIVENNTLVWADKEKGLEWLHSAKSNSQAITIQTLEDAAKVVKNLDTGMVSESESANGGEVRNSGMRYRLIGETGAERLDKAMNATFRIDGLKAARNMESAGKTPKEIKLASGWERGADGKWRYEEPDGEYVHPKNTDGIFKLGDIWHDDNLYISYPKLKNTEVEYVLVPTVSYAGCFVPRDNKIEINKARTGNRKSLIRSVLVHEIQHAIQHEEGFAFGGSGDYAVDKIFGYGLGDFTPSQLRWLTSFRKRADELMSAGKYKRLPYAIRSALKEAKDNNFYPFDNYDKSDDVSLSVEDALLNFTADQLEQASYFNRREAYMRIAGEVEARNVQKRLNYNDRTRRALLAMETEDVAREDQIILENALQALSLDSETALYFGETVEAKKGYAEALGRKLNTRIRIVEDESTLPVRLQNRKGWYEVDSGDVVVVLGNHRDAGDVAETVLHEVVGHKGLRELVGEQHYDEFCDEIYKHLKDDLKEEVDRETTRRFEREPEKGYEHHRRVAVDELFGRMAEKGFEDFTKAERGIWAKLKAKVLEAINKFLGSLKLPKWVRLGDNELRYMLWRSHERLRGIAEARRENKDFAPDYVAEAKDVAKRDELGLNGNDVIVERKTPGEVTADKIEETFNAAVAGDLKGKPVEVGILTKEGREYLEKLSGVKLKEIVSFVLNPSDLVHIYRRHFGKNESDVRNIPLTISDIRQMAEIVANPDRVIFGKEKSGNLRNMFFFLKDGANGSYNIMEVYADRKGNLTAKSFFKSKEGVSQRAMLLNESSTLTSVTDGATLFDGAKLPKLFENPTVSESESVRYRFRDDDGMPNMTIKEQTLKMSVMLADRHSEDVAVRDAAVEALGKTLGNIRKAMYAQRTYDFNTVRSLGTVADILISSGTFLPEGPGEVKRLYGIMKRGIGHAYTDDAGVEHVTQSEKVYNAAVESLMDLFVSNQLKLSGKFLDEVMKIRGSKVNARGVEVMGELDVEGQIMVRGMKDYMNKGVQAIHDRMDALDDIIANGNDAASMNAAAEKMGLELAEQYVAEVSDRVAQEKVMRDQLRDLTSQWVPSMSGDAREAYTEQKRALRESIRKIRIERADAMRQLASQVGNELRNSIERVKSFREREKQRIEEIWHNANSDMTGRAFDEHGMKKKGLGVKLSNNMVSRLLLAPAASFEQIMRVFGSKSVDGEGYLFDRYVRGWQECRDKEWTSTQEVEGILNKKAAEILGKRKARWSDLYALTRKAAGSCDWWDGGQIREHKVTQGNLMYMYMVNKMTDGQVKLRRMCITDDKMLEIEQTLDPKLKAVADWLQEELLPNLRNKYNEVHMRMFGAPMAEIEDYFPLRILTNALLEEVEMAGKIDGKDLPKTMTGAIIKRRFNNYALDVLNSDAVSVALDHIREMATWAAFAEYRRDLCTLLSYKHFRNQVKNMSTIYGSGEKLWDKFYDLSLLVGGAYRPKDVDDTERALVNLTKLATGACIAIRLNTALKQLLSYPAFAPDANLARLLYNVTPWRARSCWKWAMKNMPSFQRRWKSRQAGNDVLRSWKYDWDWTNAEFVQKVQRFGITPNAFIDALTVAMGSEAVYHSKLKGYLKDGFSKEEAHRRAIQDAEIIFNLSQQSSELPYLSLLQNKRSYITTCLTNFRNSPMSYLRQSIQSKRELANMVKGKDVQIEFETKKGVREGLTPEQAKARAERKYKRNWARSLFKSTTFDYILPALWAFGLSGLWYCIFGSDDEKKKQYAEDAMKRGLLGGFEGMTFGGTLPDFFYGLANGDKPQLKEETSPGAGLLFETANLWSNGKTERATNEMINTMIALGVGVNPQVLEDGVVAGMDFFGEDEKSARDWALLFMRVIQCPQSQIDQVYFDELGMDAREASRKTPAELAERYASYKACRANFATMWAYDDNRWDEIKDPWRKKFKKDVMERLNEQGGAHVIEKYNEFAERSKAVSKKETKANEAMEYDYVEYARLMTELQQDPDYLLNIQFKAYDQNLNRLAGMYLQAESPEEAALIVSTMSTYRAGMVKALECETDAERNREEAKLQKLMEDFDRKRQTFVKPEMKMGA